MAEEVNLLNQKVVLRLRQRQRQVPDDTGTKSLVFGIQHIDLECTLVINDKEIHGIQHITFDIDAKDLVPVLSLKLVVPTFDIEVDADQAEIGQKIERAFYLDEPNRIDWIVGKAKEAGLLMRKSPDIRSIVQEKKE